MEERLGAGPSASRPEELLLGEVSPNQANVNVRERTRTTNLQPLHLIPKIRDFEMTDWTLDLDTRITPVSAPHHRGQLFALMKLRISDPGDGRLTEAEQMFKTVKGLKDKLQVAIPLIWEYSSEDCSFSVICDFCPITLLHVVGGLASLEQQQIRSIVYQAGRGILALKTANVYAPTLPLSCFWISQDGYVKVAGYEKWVFYSSPPSDSAPPGSPSPMQTHNRADIRTIASVLASLAQRNVVDGLNISRDIYGEWATSLIRDMDNLHACYDNGQDLGLVSVVCHSGFIPQDFRLTERLQLNEQSYLEAYEQGSALRNLVWPSIYTSFVSFKMRRNMTYHQSAFNPRMTSHFENQS